MGLFDIVGRRSRTVDSGLNWILGTYAVLALFLWLPWAPLMDFAIRHRTSLVILVGAALGIAVLIGMIASFRNLHALENPGCRGSAPTVALSQELQDETDWDRVVTECEQRLNLIPADPLFASRLHASVSAGRAGQGSAS